MATHVFNEAKRALLAGELDLNGHDIRAMLVMTNTTVDTENDGISTISQFTTLDEFNGSGYTRKALANEAVNKDDGNDRAEFDADDVTWTALGAGSRSVQGVLIYRHVTNDADSVPICFLEFATAKTPDGSDFVLQFDPEGILQAA